MVKVKYEVSDAIIDWHTTKQYKVLFKFLAKKMCAPCAENTITEIFEAGFKSAKNKKP